MISRTSNASRYSLLGGVNLHSTSRKGKAALLVGLVVVCICSVAFVLLSKSFSFSWVPISPAWSIPVDHSRLELDFGSTETDGKCRFLSPLDQLSTKERDALARHIARPFPAQRGLLEGAEDGLHPIYQLLFEGTENFSRLLSKPRSSTLAEAVAEYIRRYKRNPPRGFDWWFQYAQEHDVLFVDEYDSIHRSLKPFWGFHVEERRRRQLEVEDWWKTITFVKEESGEMSWKWTAGDITDPFLDQWGFDRAQQQLEIFNKMKHLLPIGFRWSLGINDYAAITPRWDEVDALNDLRSGALLLPTYRIYKTNETTEPTRTRATRNGLRHVQQPHGPVRACLISVSIRSRHPWTAANLCSTQPASLSFVSSPYEASDMCQHPSIFNEHGVFVRTHPEQHRWQHHSRLLPIGAVSKAQQQGDILTALPESGPWAGWENDSKTWEEKVSRLYWAGHYTDMDIDREQGSGRWRRTQRTRMHRLANPLSHEEKSDVLVTEPVGMGTTVQELTNAELSNRYYNISLVVGCDQVEPRICEEMTNVFGIDKPGQPGNLIDDFKYLLDLDGGGWSIRFLRLMWSNALVFKSTLYHEWNYDFLPHWFGYVPVKLNYNDLPSIVAFFAGPPGRPEDHHDKVAQVMAHNGRCWAERTWRIEDVHAYQMRLFLGRLTIEYARLLHSDDPGADFVIDDR